MLSKSEKKYLSGRMFSKEYKYVLKHRVGEKLLELSNDLDLILESKEYFKDFLKTLFENFLVRLENQK